MGKQPPKKDASAKPRVKQTDAVHMLKADHQQVKKLFERFGNASPDERPVIAAQVFTELEVHTIVEEELFYPALRHTMQPAGLFDADAQENGLDVVDPAENETVEEPINGMELDAEEEEETDEELITVAYEEHQAVKDLMQQLKTLDPTSSDYRDVFSELEDAVLEHFTGEEDILFPMAVSELDTLTLGAKMQQRRDEWLSSRAA
jgi:hemerythrin superfamily protein